MPDTSLLHSLQFEHLSEVLADSSLPADLRLAGDGERDEGATGVVAAASHASNRVASLDS